MGIVQKRLRVARKIIECIGALAIITWLMFPYPYTWDEMGKIVPGAQYGVLIPSLIYIWLSLRERYRSESVAINEKAPSNDPS